jgi:multidrug resistance efflux pump
VDDAIPLDGRVVSTVPLLQLMFPQGVSGRLLTVYVQVGQQVHAGERIAAVDDGALQAAVDAAQDNLERARETQARVETQAEAAYALAVEAAEWTLERAKHDLAVSSLSSPTTALRQAEVNAARALDTEALAADRYQQSLERSWEDQEVRDALYKEWQARVADRELAELQVEDLETRVKIHGMELALSRRAVTRAQAAVERVEKAVDPRYAYAVADAVAALAQAEADLALATLTAPRDGLVTSIDAATGTWVDLHTSIVTLLDVDDLSFVTLNLDERRAAYVRPGQAVRITLRFYPQETIGGEVDVLVPEGGREATRFVAHIRLVDTRGLDLLPGMTGRAEIVIE